MRCSLSRNNLFVILILFFLESLNGNSVHLTLTLGSDTTSTGLLIDLKNAHLLELLHAVTHDLSASLAELGGAGSTTLLSTVYLKLETIFI